MSSDKYYNPDTLVGYGIPDMYKAWLLITDQVLSPVEQIEKQWKVYPNPFSERIILSSKNQIQGGKTEIEIYTLDGKLLRHWMKPAASTIELNNLNLLPQGILLLKIKNSGVAETFKLSKVW